MRPSEIIFMWEVRKNTHDQPRSCLLGAIQTHDLAGAHEVLLETLSCHLWHVAVLRAKQKHD